MYGERRHIRDDLLHIEAMQRQCDLVALQKQSILDRLNLMAYGGSASSKVSTGSARSTPSVLTSVSYLTSAYR